MQNIKAIHGFPQGTPIDSVQVKIVKLYKREIKPTAYGDKSKQDGVIQDATGEIKFSAWEHPELEPLLNKEVVIHASSQGKGLKVSIYKDKPYLEVGKMGQFQNVAVYRETKGLPEAPAASQPSTPAPVSVRPVAARETASDGVYLRGEAAGAAVNKVMDTLIAEGQVLQLAKDNKLADAIVSIGSQVAEGSLRLQKIDFASKPAKATIAPGATGSGSATSGPDEDVPF